MTMLNLLVILAVLDWRFVLAQDVTGSHGCSMGCIPGIPGSPGGIGSPGRDGRDGVKGNIGAVGNTGPVGPAGDNGAVGPPGESGAVGSPGDVPSRNIKQCAWQNLNDGREDGVIRGCEFNKMSDNTALRVLWNGNLRLLSAGSSCSRWYFTLNGDECNDPLPIDTVIYTHGSQNYHVGIAVEGFCNGIDAGQVLVEFRVSSGCGGHPGSDAYTGWSSVSRIILEEVAIQ